MTDSDKVKEELKKSLTNILVPVLCGASIGGAGSYMLTDMFDPKASRKIKIRNALLGMGTGSVIGLSIAGKQRSQISPIKHNYISPSLIRVPQPSLEQVK